MPAWGHYGEEPRTWEYLPPMPRASCILLNRGPHYGESVGSCPAEHPRKEIYQRGGTQSLGFNLSCLLSVFRKHTGPDPPPTPRGPRLGILCGHRGTLLLSWRIPSIVRKCHLTWDAKFPGPALNCAMHWAEVPQLVLVKMTMVKTERSEVRRADHCQGSFGFHGGTIRSTE